MSLKLKHGEDSSRDPLTFGARNGMTRSALGAPNVSLEALLEQSIRRGHRRVALQRVLMMEARGLPVDEAAHDFCRPARLAVPRREYERMLAAARAWARMVSGRERGGFE